LILPTAVDLERAAERQWRRCGPPLVWENAPGEGAVFDPASGETHFLSELPALLLSSIGQEWHNLASLVVQIAGTVDLDDQHRAKILSALTFLESAELVESRYAEKT
jgi:hypothetical protein